MPETRVRLVQLLCPHRHCILATAYQCDTGLPNPALAEALRKAAAEMIAEGAFDPWCGLCRAPLTEWRVEDAPTRFRSMEEARPHLEQCQREQLATAAFLRRATAPN